MTLRLVIESASRPQRVLEMRHAGGDMSIGRGPECDWQLDDPDMYISRRHCVISGRDGRWTVMDASRGGLFIDGSDRPLGPGNAAVLEHGTRLRLGDVVLRAEVETTAPRAAPAAQPATGSGFDGDDFFARRATPAPTPPPRPESLPEPFERPQGGFVSPADRGQPAPPRSPAFDDPFTMDPLPTPPSDLRVQARPPSPPSGGPGAAATDFGFGDIFAEPTPAPAVAPTPLPQPPVAATAMPLDVRPLPAPVTLPTAALHAEIAAFLRGAGLDPDLIAPDQSEAAMQALGQRFRALAEGVVVMLRTRAREKGTARVAQTVIGSAAVNPLKFLASADEAVASVVTPRGPGYLDPDDAIAAAFRDLSDHQMRSWVALQTALRRMIDRFDPAIFESEADKAGLMQALLSGGRHARLWQLYLDRYRDMARAAEDRFLGEVGADFRDAYEQKHKEDQR